MRISPALTYGILVPFVVLPSKPRVDPSPGSRPAPGSLARLGIKNLGAKDTKSRYPNLQDSLNLYVRKPDGRVSFLIVELGASGGHPAVRGTT